MMPRGGKRGAAAASARAARAIAAAAMPRRQRCARAPIARVTAQIFRAARCALIFTEVRAECMRAKMRMRVAQRVSADAVMRLRLRHDRCFYHGDIYIAVDVIMRRIAMMKMALIYYGAIICYSPPLVLLSGRRGDAARQKIFFATMLVYFLFVYILY